MDKRDEQLLQHFFSEAAQQTIEDNGFTERVMRRLPAQPDRIKWFNRLWTAFCVTVAVILFTVFHGWELLAVQIEVFIRTTLVDPPQVNIMVAVLMLFSLLMVGLYEVLRAERVLQ